MGMVILRRISFVAGRKIQTQISSRFRASRALELSLSGISPQSKLMRTAKAFAGFRFCARRG
jgi:hypothetical protein